ncbi:helix-turn-helix domain-containing protein [Chitinophaga solisilvae]|uniref:Helix-turn-helix domain-containing protein n=1 Tax=Chitinophaga solisilvae TaxID=1233460 RepID=A0A433W8S8_9BACT|nr:helix-turn-helix domain-containing protein [Chitinophaga solisilvae]NSL86985.1 helix-turn-helix domain-containing protein [Chitinophaga solisilvae]
MIELGTFADNGELHLPARHMHYILIWCTRGSVTVVVDEKVLTVKEQEALTITSGQVHYFRDFAGAEGMILRFSLSFFCKDDNDIELVFQNGLFCHFDMNEVIPVPQADLINAQLQSIREELQEKPYQYLITVHARIELILIAINRAKIGRGDEIWKPDALFLKFLEQARGNFDKNYNVREHARLLGTTEAKLNEQSRLHTGKTAQNVLYGLIISEAKRLLTYQRYTVKEVAYMLGFNDPFYFSNFFKKSVQLSPKVYQEQHQL